MPVSGPGSKIPGVKDGETPVPTSFKKVRVGDRVVVLLKGSHGGRYTGKCESQGGIGRGGRGGTFQVCVGRVLTQHKRGWGGTFHRLCWGRVNTSNRWCVVVRVVVLCCVVLCCVVLFSFCVMLCYVVLCCVVLCCVVSFLVLFWVFFLCHFVQCFCFLFCCVVLCCVLL